MKKILFSILMVVVVIAMSIVVTAESETDGFLLKFKNDKAREIALQYVGGLARLASDENSAPAIVDVYQPANLYKGYDENIISLFAKLGLLEYYEPNYICYLFDYDYNSDYHYANRQINWEHFVGKANDAWNYGVYGNDVKVAVIDSGIRATHIDLVDRVLPGISYVDYNSDGHISEDEKSDYSDNNGHGTAVAGVIAAAVNGRGAVGVAHKAKIVPVKITDAGTFTTGYIAASILWCVDNDVDVINMSLGVNGDSRTIRNAVNTAIDNNIIVVAASGNVGGKISQGDYIYPAAQDNVVSVGNLQMVDSIVSVNSSSVQNDKVTVVAPGTGVVLLGKSADDSFSSGGGTSYSCPYVSGIAALAKSIDKSITPAEFMEILISTADKSILDGKEYDNSCGYGIADAGAVVERMIATRSKGGFMSPIDRKSDMETNVTVFNTGESSKTYTFLSQVRDGLRPVSFRSHVVTLEPGEKTEMVLPSVAQGSDMKYSCFLFDEFNLSPMYRKVES